jgi:opacity protein-like surface antigen
VRSATWRCSTASTETASTASTATHDWFGTVRGRLGYAIDRLLIYATGGVPFTDRQQRRNDFNGFGASAPVSRTARRSSARGSLRRPGAACARAALNYSDQHRLLQRHATTTTVGWTVGGGVEYAFTSGFFGLKT